MVKYHLIIFQYEVTHETTPKSWKVKILIDNNHLIYLSDHLSGLLKWKYEVRAFQIRIERLQKYSSDVKITRYAKSYLKMCVLTHWGPKLVKIT